MSVPVVHKVSHSLNWMSMVCFAPARSLAKERMRVSDRLRKSSPLTLAGVGGGDT
jgi:hypothetical protein